MKYYSQFLESQKRKSWMEMYWEKQEIFPFLYPLKATKSRNFPNIFREYGKGTFAWYELRRLGWWLINPFVPNAPFLYALKTSETFTVFWYFQRVEKRYIGNEWVNTDSLWKLLYKFLGWKLCSWGRNQEQKQWNFSTEAFRVTIK